MLKPINLIEIDYANNGEEALSKIKDYANKNLTFDYIFMDIMMPVLDGI